MSPAIDRFTVSPETEFEAQEIAALIAKDYALLCGYLSESVATFLSRPRWSPEARRRLAQDLRIVEIVKERSVAAEESRREAARVRYGW